jgi:hypothetical protein
MHTNISNIIDALLAVIALNQKVIDECIAAYEPDRRLSVFKGLRKTLPRSAYPALELEPVDGSTSWNTNMTQMPEYTVQFVMTICTDNQELSVEYIGTLTRLVLEILNNPQNMALLIPREYSYLPNVGETETRTVDAMVSNVSYNSAKQGTFRVSQWNWTCKIREGARPSDVDNSHLLKATTFHAHPLPPVTP